MNPQLLSELRAIVGEKAVISRDDELMVYECDACVAFKRRPEIVVLPASTEEVAMVVRCADRLGVPIVPRRHDRPVTQADGRLMDCGPSRHTARAGR